MDDTILRLFPIDCGGLPSAARKRSERAKSFSCPAVIMIVSSLACHAEPERRSVVEDSPPSGNPVSPAPTHQKSIIYNALRASKCRSLCRHSPSGRQRIRVPTREMFFSTFSPNREWTCLRRCFGRQAWVRLVTPKPVRAKVGLSRRSL